MAARTGTAASGAKATVGGAKGSSAKGGAKASVRAAAGGGTRNGVPGHGGRRLVIVESPAKARTIAGYLGKDYVVESSIGHIRDMPDKAAEIPAKYRGSRGHGSAWTWTMTSSRSTWSTPTSGSRSPS